eukprot:CAMPEP_0117695176 /NCGR_PEP_ID=MMETSP0804-20121206/27995_1 /TAXON_ID=1074897 /ORGANISM="Tetraselmis astigmatica, Strain CCMP880" /LENGTH=1085 /DNA_ID=CAMNT_0005509221 /DNA_START=121 /DNA_END=3379 /DNA_ORIENTATION=-
MEPTVPGPSLEAPIRTNRLPSGEFKPPSTPTLANYERSQVQVYVWGRGDLGQLGTGEAVSRSEPKLVAALQDTTITHVAAGMFNSAFTSLDGELYTAGDNELGQLGFRTAEGRLLEPRRVQALETSAISHVSVGLGHIVAVTDKGMLASWGGAEFGQLGHGSVGVSVPQPRLIQGIRGVQFRQVACGACHCLALTSSGQVYAFGQGTFGALGHGHDQNVETPMMIEKLWAVGVVQAAGENHSAALSVDGRLLTWGRGKYGQLGLGDFYSKQTPGIQICCGGDHTMLLSQRGEVYSWGRGTWGQTGLGSTDNTCLPRRIEAFDGYRIVQVAAGARHSLAMDTTGAVYCFGNGEEGQLGLGEAGVQVALVSPRRVPAASLPAGGNRLPWRSCFVAAGGDFSALVATKETGRAAGLPEKLVSLGEGACGLGVSPITLPNLLELATEATGHDGADPPVKAVKDMARAIESVFTSAGFLIGGFMLPAGRPSDDNPRLQHGLDMEVVKQVYNVILCTYSSEVVMALVNSTVQLLEGCEKAAQSPGSAPQAEWLKALLIVAQNPVLGDTKHGPTLVARLTAVLSVLTAPSQQVLAEWIGSSFSKEEFAVRLVRPVQKYISQLCSSQFSMQQNRPELMQAIQLLDFLHEISESSSSLIKHEEFYNKEVSENANLREEYMVAIDASQMQRVPIKSLCQTPFILTPEAKSRILQGEANLQKRHMIQNSNFQALLTGMNPGLFAWLHVRVRRENLLEDTLNEIIQHPQDLKKPLKVTFMSAGVVEEGLDEGGVAREFFMLLTKELLDVKYGMFEYLPETRTYWFNQVSMEPDINFRLVGILLGLAIYNNVILDIHFPMVTYKKLLGLQPEFQDLKKAMPELGRGLQQLLDFDGDVEEVFARNFEVEYDCYGEMRAMELVEGGSSKPVTNANRHEYVELYTKWALNDSVQRHFTAFSDGFHEVCGGPALRLFRHEELELLVCGLPHLDFEALESVTRYDGGYTKDSAAVRMFWKILHSLTIEQKKRFLLFTTGCDRAPVGGLAHLPLVIQRSGPDTDRLPTSHTCFHILLLPEYSTEEKMRERLLTATENAEGFGLQ